MTPPALRVDRFTLILAALGLAGAALILLRHSGYGVGLSIDSTSYIANARALLEGRGFTFHDYPPMFPMAVAFAGFLGVDVVDGAGYVNAAAFGLTVFAVAAWLRSRVESRFIVLWAGGALALSPLLADIFAKAWTEPLFILFTVLSLFALDRFLTTDKRRFLLMAAACAALAGLTRWLGVSVVAAAVLLLLLRDAEPIQNRLRNVAVFSAIALAPLGAWMLWNLWSSGTLTGEKYQTGFAFLVSFNEGTSALLKWVLGDVGYRYLIKGVYWITRVNIAETGGIAGAALKTGLLLALAWAVGRALARLCQWRGWQSWRILAVPAAFIAFYALATAILLPLTNIGAEDRYFAPLYAPGLVAVALILNEFMRWASGRRPLQRLEILSRWGMDLRKGALVSAPTLILTACLSLWLVGQLSANYGDVRLWVNNGFGYGGKQWAESETIDYIKSNPPEGRVFSNDHRALWLQTDISGVHPLEPPPPSSPKPLTDQAHAAGQDAYFVWFYTPIFLDLRLLTELLALPGMELTAALKDGVILKAARDSTYVGPPPDQEAIVNAILKDTDHIINSDFEVHLDEDANRLVYLKRYCAPGHTEAKFFLHLYPEKDADSPSHRQPYGFDNLDFSFEDGHGFRVAGQCVAARQLPGYPIESLRTGQYSSERGQLWASDTISGSYIERLWSSYETAVAGEPVIRSTFDVYLRENVLTYAKEPCERSEAVATFFLHLTPENVEDLPEIRRQYGFDNLDFRFSGSGAVFDDKCVATITLPDYPIAGIRTGQYIPSGDRLWQGAIVASIEGSEEMRAEYRSVTAGEPAVRSTFDVYLRENALTYVKEPCAPSDASATFFLHVTPANLEDIPEGRRQSGFDNFDFRFGERGVIFEDKCMVTMPLPGYPIAGVRTGQYIPDAGQLWKVEFPYPAP